MFEILLVKNSFNEMYREGVPRLFLQHVLDPVHIVRCHWVFPGGSRWWLLGDHGWGWGSGGRAIPAFLLSKLSSTLIFVSFLFRIHHHGNTLVETVNCVHKAVEFDEKSNHEKIISSHADHREMLPSQFGSIHMIWWSFYYSTNYSDPFWKNLKCFWFHLFVL